MGSHYKAFSKENPMKVEFLEGLVGLNVADAETIVLKANHLCWVISEDCMAISAVARGNTVVLWQKNGKVISAEAGDPCELV